MLVDLWIFGVVFNHVGIYGSKVAQGFSAFQRRSCCYLHSYVPAFILSYFLSSSFINAKSHSLNTRHQSYPMCFILTDGLIVVVYQNT